ILLLVAAMIFFSFAGVVLAIYFVPNPSLLFGRPEIGSPSDQVIIATLVDTEFKLPETIVANIDKPLLGNAKRIDLRLPWPFDRQQLNIVHALPTDLQNWLLITLEPRLGRTGLEERMAPIYSVYLDPVEAHEAGLVLRKFKADSPYTDSELLVASSGEVIRCDKKPSVLGPIICERFWPFTPGVMARIRFSRQRLEEWRDMDETAQILLKEFTR
ncbi:MAG: hypothetical protein ACRD2L_19015, partial [Terriglobia bacterium]